MRNFLPKILLILFLTLVINEKEIHVENNMTLKKEIIIERELLYDNIWGTIYHAEKRQCDNTPTITGDGSKIIPNKASSHRWIAICHEMLDDEYRSNLLKNPNEDRFKGKIKYGDTVWIETENSNINGWWVVHDTKHKRVKNSVDFLQTKNDGSLYNNNRLWSGRFKNLKIYRLYHTNYSTYN